MSISAYQTDLRAAARGFWSGILDFDQFFSSMQSTIRRGLTRAWYLSAQEVGIKPDELTADERVALDNAILQEINRIRELAAFIEENTRDKGGKLAALYSRLMLWVNRFRDIKNLAKQMASNDPKLEWVLGATEQHCRTCPRLNGKVKRASFWRNLGLRPQDPPNSNLECGGWRCLCELRPTDRAVSKGKLPSVP